MVSILTGSEHSPLRPTCGNRAELRYPVDNGATYKTAGRDDSDGPNFVELAKVMRKELDSYGEEAGKEVEMSIAVPSKPVDMIAYNMTDVTSGLDKTLDFWNLMLYDYLNRRDNVTNYHAGAAVIEQNLNIWHGELGIKSEKLNLGYPMYAKWFRIQGSCTSDPPIGCPMGNEYEDAQGEDSGDSGTVTFNSETNDKQDMWTIFNAFDEGGFSDDTAMASATVKDNVFWTWLSPKDISASCSKYIDQAGGVMVWSLNQDSEGVSGGPHIKAVAGCVA